MDAALDDSPSSPIKRGREEAPAASVSLKTGSLDALETPFTEFKLDKIKANEQGARDGPKTLLSGYTLYIAVPRPGMARTFWVHNVRFGTIKPASVPKGARPTQTLSDDRFVMDGRAWNPWDMLQVCAYLDDDKAPAYTAAFEAFRGAIVKELVAHWPEYVETMSKSKPPAFLTKHAPDAFDAMVKSVVLPEHTTPKGKAVAAALYPKIAGWMREMVKAVITPSKIGYSALSATFEHRPTSVVNARSTSFLLRALNPDGSVVGCTSRVPHTADGFWDSAQDPLKDEAGRDRFRRVGPADVTEGSRGSIECEVYGFNYDDQRKEFSPKFVVKTIEFVPAPRTSTDEEPAPPEEEDAVLEFLKAKKAKESAE